MGYILCIETGTNTCSVALGKGGVLVDLEENHDKENNHSKLLTVFVNKLLNRQNLKVSDLSAVCVGKGPGSYTGLRIGVSVAKGLCYGAGIPLLAVGSLHAMALGMIEQLTEDTTTVKPQILCPMIDARRMEVYTQQFDLGGNSLSEVEALILDEKSYESLLQQKSILFFGNGSHKFKDFVSAPNALFWDDFLPSARFMISEAEKHYRNEKFEDTAYFEPFYLKDFIATIPKNKIF